MDPLKCEKGFTIIEVLTSIVVLGLVVTLSIILANKIFNYSGSASKNDVFLAVSNEMQYTLHNRRTIDTSYFSGTGRHKIFRSVKELEYLYEIEV